MSGTTSPCPGAARLAAVVLGEATLGEGTLGEATLGEAEPAVAAARDGAVAAAAHLATCAACQARAARLEEALTPERTAEPPPGVLDALLRAVGDTIVSEARERGAGGEGGTMTASVQTGAAAPEAASASSPGEGPPPGRGAATIRVACCYCHAPFVRHEAVFCAACLAPHHGDCFAKHGRCSAPGCGETSFVEPRSELAAGAAPRPPGRRRLRGLVLPLGLVALTGAAAVAAYEVFFAGAPAQGGDGVAALDTSRLAAEAEARAEALYERALRELTTSPGDDAARLAAIELLRQVPAGTRVHPDAQAYLAWLAADLLLRRSSQAFEAGRVDEGHRLLDEALASDVLSAEARRRIEARRARYGPRPPAPPAPPPPRTQVAPVDTPFGWGVDARNTARWPYVPRTITRVAWSHRGGEHPGMPLPGADGRVYVQAGGGAVRCLDAATGAPLWVGPGGGGFNYTTSVLGPDGRSYGSAYGGIRCLDPAGRLVWDTDLAAGWLHDPPALSPDGRTLLVASEAIGVYALDAADGRVRWRSREQGSRVTFCFDGVGRVLVCDRTLGRLLCLGVEEGDLVWGSTLALDACLVTASNEVVGWQGNTVCALDATRVTTRYWHFDSTTVTGAAVRGPGELVVALATGDLVGISLPDLFGPRPERAEAWRQHVSEHPLAAPVTTADGQVLVVDAAGKVFLCSADHTSWHGVQLPATQPGFFPRAAVGPDGRVYVSGREAVFCLTDEEDPAGRTPPPQPPPPPDAAVAPVTSRVLVVADDFVVDAWVNGERVPDAARECLEEAMFGPVTESLQVELRPGDWIVFHVAFNRLRGGGATAYFAACGVDGAGQVRFSTDTGPWTVCDDPGKVAAFVTVRDAGSEAPAQEVARPWPQAADHWRRLLGLERPPRALWGARDSVWLKLVVPQVGR